MVGDSTFKQISTENEKVFWIQFWKKKKKIPESSIEHKSA